MFRAWACVALVVLSATVVGLRARAEGDSEVPGLNKKVLEFARDKLGEKVGDGECATLAVQALSAAGGEGFSDPGEGDYVWGKLVRTVTPGENSTGEVLPGDIVQFRDVITSEATFPHHTAIVETVKGDGADVELLHQNINDVRKVQRTTLRFGDLKKGSVKIYRPRAAAAAARSNERRGSPPPPKKNPPPPTKNASPPPPTKKVILPLPKKQPPKQAPAPQKGS
jgi:hypothetical protein